MWLWAFVELVCAVWETGVEEVFVVAEVEVEDEVGSLIARFIGYEAAPAQLLVFH